MYTEKLLDKSFIVFSNFLFAKNLSGIYILEMFFERLS